jgi:ATP phosphoribosyltransferase regulatory subunit
MKPPTQLPKGARIYLPDEAWRKRHVESCLLDVFARWGYRELITPTFEFFDVLSVGTDPLVQEDMFKMVDRETGRLLALRADITPQIARVVATRLREEPKPLRLDYVTNVFRYDEPQLAHYREFYQAGVELIGLDKPEAEVEILAMTVEGLSALGLARFQIDVGHPDFFRGLMEETAATEEQAREVRAALGRKDLAELEKRVGELGVPAHVADALLALPTLFGRAEVLERAAGFARTPRAARALANLTEVYRLLGIYGLADAVLLDLGEVRGFEYYSGMYFETYVADFGASVAAGGRYDHMLGRFGYECPAVGFAFDVARALSVMEHQGVPVPLPGPDFFIVDSTPDKTAALSLARRLRDLGASVARDIVSRGLPESLAYARSQRATQAIVIGSARTGEGEALVIELATERERVVPIPRMLEQPQQALEGFAARLPGRPAPRAVER